MTRISVFNFIFFFGLVCHIGNCENISECGMVKSRTTETETSRGEYPFVAALYKIKNSQFFCGGTLISSKHVLTAAHCIQAKSSSFTLGPSDIEVRLGVEFLSSKSESDILQRNVSEIHVHPDWNVYSEKYDADVAILVLSDTVKFTNYIRPVCLPGDSVFINGNTGSVVGWSYLENKTWHHGEFLRQSVTNALNGYYCYITDYISASISSVRTFCGDSGDRSPYRGDAGGGFFVNSGSVWVQHGILSALRSDHRGHIDSDAFAIFTNITFFKNWIEEFVGQSGDAVMTVGEPIQMKINLHCQMIGYMCAVHGSDIRSANIEVMSFTGVDNINDHITNRDVRWIAFSPNMSYIPDGIGKLLINLSQFEVKALTGLKELKRSNFQNMENLKIIKIFKNDIEIVDEDVLWDLQNLEKFVLIENKVKVLGDKTFEKNLKLKIVDLRYNQLEFLHGNLFKNNLFLERVHLKNNFLKVADVDFTTFNNINQVLLDGNLYIDAIYYNVTNNVTTFSSFYRKL